MREEKPGYLPVAAFKSGPPSNSRYKMIEIEGENMSQNLVDATLAPAVDTEEFIATDTSVTSTSRTEVLQEAFREQLEALVSDLPGRWSERIGQARGDTCIETTFGGTGLNIEDGNRGLAPIINLLTTGSTGSIYWNPAKEMDLVSDQARVKRTVFETDLNEPVVVVQGKLPDELVTDGTVMGPSPYIRRMLSVYDVKDFLGRLTAPEPRFSLEHVERIALAVPDSDLDGSEMSNREAACSERYLELIDKLAEHGIRARPESEGERFQDVLRSRLQERTEPIQQPL